MHKMRFAIFILLLLFGSSCTAQEDELDCYGEYGDLTGVTRNRMDKFLEWIINNMGSPRLKGRVIRQEQELCGETSPRWVWSRYTG